MSAGLHQMLPQIQDFLQDALLQELRVEQHLITTGTLPTITVNAITPTDGSRKQTLQEPQPAIALEYV